MAEEEEEGEGDEGKPPTSQGLSARSGVSEKVTGSVERRPCHTARDPECGGGGIRESAPSSNPVPSVALPMVFRDGQCQLSDALVPEHFK